MSRSTDVYTETCLEAYKPVFAPDALAGKVAFVTGGGSGIGFRITEMFLRHGATAMVASRSLDRVKTAAATLTAGTGRRCEAVSMDVRNPDDVERAVGECVSRLGRIDILVNGAAGNFLCAAGALSYRAFKTVMEIDAHGAFNVSRATHAAWMATHGGTIINITATLHYRGDLLQAHAGAAKAAIDAITRHLAREWGPQGIRVNSLAPGPIADTEGFRRLGGFMPDDAKREFTSRIPAQRFGSREDCGNAAVFLASPAASYVTGHVLVVDGGAWMCDASAEMFATSKL